MIFDVAWLQSSRKAADSTTWRVGSTFGCICGPSGPTSTVWIPRLDGSSPVITFTVSPFVSAWLAAVMRERRIASGLRRIHCLVPIFVCWRPPTSKGTSVWNSALSAGQASKGVRLGGLDHPHASAVHSAGSRERFACQSHQPSRLQYPSTSLVESRMICSNLASASAACLLHDKGLPETLVRKFAIEACAQDPW